MKYPKNFTMTDREGGHDVEVTYDDVKKVYMLDYGNGKPIPFVESEVTRLLNDYYDIVEDNLAFTDTFSFFHDTTTQQFDMKKLPHHNLWACQQNGLPAVGSGATYTAEEIANNFAMGYWREVSFSEPVDRPLAFPFTFECGSEGILYYASGLDERGRVKIVYEYNGEEMKTDLEELHLKTQIKAGNWLVKSAGKDAWDYYFGGGVAKSLLEPAEPPTSASNDISELTIRINSDAVVEATQRLNALAQAAENVNIAMESFQSIFEDTRELLAGGVQGQCVTFCCEEG